MRYKLVSVFSICRTVYCITEYLINLMILLIFFVADICRIFGMPQPRRFEEPSQAEIAWEEARESHFETSKAQGKPVQQVVLLHLRAVMK